uniref:Poly [ADP-ribose] polymerase 4 n=1 Tax=Phallusia mammillata TaxID=59560 RepID=A0A6F9DNU9_9ASCI|nr:poly [ADP-ribose] polymerase 4 [Phallusia mammillata]
MVAEVTIFQVYLNKSKSELEAKYVFPLDGSAAVCGFEAFINNKHIIGKVKEKEVAHQEYKEAVSQGHGAYLMDEEKPEVFTVSVGNLPPSCQVIIKITYVTELPILIDDKDLTDYIQFYLPSSLAPSVEDNVLVSGPITQTTTDQAKTNVQQLKEFSLMVCVEMPFDIRRLESPTNKIVTKRTRSKAVVKLAKKEKLGAEGFRLLVGLAEIHVPRMWVEDHPDYDSQACMLAFYPEFDVQPIHDYRAIIMLDMSNSMSDLHTQNMESEAKALALMVLKNLPKNCQINLMRFGSSYQELFVMNKALKDNMVAMKAEEFLQESTAELGLSDAWRPLTSESVVSEFSNRNILTNMFLISDGHLTEENKLLHLAAKLGQGVKKKKGTATTRIFTFTVG